LEDGEGGLWFGTYGAPYGGPGRLKDGRWTYWAVEDGLPHPNITSLVLARDGRVWAGCGLYDRGGAAVFGASSGAWRLESVLPVPALAGPKVRSLYQDRSGRTWLGSEKDGLAIRQEDRTLRILRPADGLPEWEVMAIAQS